MVPAIVEQEQQACHISVGILTLKNPESVAGPQDLARGDGSFWAPVPRN